ncbi:unnamed protein product [Adineta ricciae]|uniref:MYND-type domain-containing protein n=1 Tax=Adineta ricciae TaxID=249248 RepID=A0A814Q8F8_ADIRI|nr:unnamed protein product [Adineta ricciae]CAF1116158.1 unnamed protein product [Adineta ricciae]
MTVFIETPYIAALKESYLRSRCSACFKPATSQCAQCLTVVYCDSQCRVNDSLFHQLECQAYKNSADQHGVSDAVLARMIARVISRLRIDGGEPEQDLCSNISKLIHRRSWSDLLGHRDEVPRSERHWNQWLITKQQVKSFFGNQFDRIDLLEIFGKLLINRFRVGIHENVRDGRVAVGWAIYLTTSRFNHSCQPDLLQCSYDINMRLKIADSSKTFPETTAEFNQLTLSYRHQNDFRLTYPCSYVPTRQQRRAFVSFFFFNCHCDLCADDLRNRYAESATNRLCERCGDSLVLQENYDDSTESILTCLGRRKCLKTEEIVDCVTLPKIDNTEQSVDIYEEQLENVEQLLHPESILLLQLREKLFFIYQNRLNQFNLDKDQQLIYINRAIQLGEQLIQVYNIYLKDSSVYPKIVVTDVASLYELIGKTEKAKVLYQEAIDLWQADYDGHIDYRDLNMKL